MKVAITRARLAEAAQAVKGLVSKDGLSAFSKIRLDASGCLSATGSNGDVQVEWRMDGDYGEPEIITDRWAGSGSTPQDGDYAVVFIFHNRSEEGGAK